jgi:hypothetical protein
MCSGKQRDLCIGEGIYDLEKQVSEPEDGKMNSTMAEICGYLVCAFIGGLAAKILVLIWTDRIDLKELLSEANGDASMSWLHRR